MTPFGEAGSAHCSSSARPCSLFSTLKLARPLGEASRVWTVVQGLDTWPAPLTASKRTLYVVYGSNPNTWAWKMLPYNTKDTNIVSNITIIIDKIIKFIFLSLLLIITITISIPTTVIVNVFFSLKIKFNLTRKKTTPHNSYHQQ